MFVCKLASVFIFAVTITHSEANVSFCHVQDLEFFQNGKQFQFQNGNENFEGQRSCFGAIVFEEPTEIFAACAGFSRFCVKKRLCSSHSWNCTTSLENQKIQVIYAVSTAETQNSLNRISFRKCSSNIINSKNSTFQRKRRRIRRRRSTDAAEAATHEASEQETMMEKVLGQKSLTEKVIEQEILTKKFMDQTKRMFYFLANLNPESVQSQVRVVSILEKTVDLVTSLCDPNFLSPLFMREALRGFLFMFKEQGSDGVIDLEEQDFANLTFALDSCATVSAPLTLLGVNCPSEVKVKAVSRFVNGEAHTVAYAPTTFSFEWGKYDIFIDAMWYAMNIVHGACYSTFQQTVNLHHKYEVSLEQLFKGDILARWRQPVTLVRESQYDHILLASVNQSMHVLDACTVGAYILSPFQHRLQRPDKVTLERNRRETPNSKVRAHCVQKANMKDGLSKLKKKLC